MFSICIGFFVLQVTLVNFLLELNTLILFFVIFVQYLVPLSADATVEELKAFMSQKTKVHGKNVSV